MTFKKGQKVRLRMHREIEGTVITDYQELRGQSLVVHWPWTSPGVSGNCTDPRAIEHAPEPMPALMTGDRIIVRNDWGVYSPETVQFADAPRWAKLWNEGRIEEIARPCMSVIWRKENMCQS